MLTTSELDFVTNEASNLGERLSGQFEMVGGGTDALAQRRLARWKEVVAGRASQHSMSSFDGPVAYSNAYLIPLLGSVRRAHGEPVPPWAILLAEIVEHLAVSFEAKGAGVVVSNTAASKTRRIPYEHLFWPITDFAWRRVAARHPSAAGLMTKLARRSLQRHLVERIASIVSVALHPQFLAHKAVEESGMLPHFLGWDFSGDDRDKRSIGQYDRFIAQQGSEGMRGFFLKFPVAARLISEVVFSWAGFVDEFVNRFQEDRSALAFRFNAGVSLGQIVAIRAGLSDPHQGGRSVLLITFSSGIKLIYKPRPLEADRLYFELIDKLNDHGLTPNLRCLGIHGGDGYGWMEFARQASCPSKAAARRYYSRAGSLLGLVHWLQGIDFHRENVVAAGEYPMLVDLESLAHPFRPEENSEGDVHDGWPFAGSALRTGLLPLWQERGINARRYDNSGFEAPIRQRGLFPNAAWQNVNTDGMRYGQQIRLRYHRRHRATIQGKLITARDYVESVIAGYRRIEKFLSGPGAGCFEALREQIWNGARRQIRRPTALYQSLLSRSIRPEYLKAGVDRSIELQALPCDEGGEEGWRQEIASLEVLDVPYFTSAKNPQATSSAASPIQLGLGKIQTHLIRLSLDRRLILKGNRIYSVARRS